MVLMLFSHIPAEDSAWTVVDGGVYDVTEFLEDVSTSQGALDHYHY